MSKNFVVPRIALAALLGFCAWLLQKPQGVRDPGAEAALAFVEAAILNGSTFEEPSLRGPASVKPDRHRHDPGERHEGSKGVKGSRHTHKLSSGVEVAIFAPQDFQTSKPMHLIGTVKSSTDLPSGEVSWQVPSGVEVIEGDRSSVLENLEAGQAYSFHLVVKQTDNINRQVHLSFSAKQGDMEFSEQAQHNTVDQKGVDMAIQKLNQRHLKYLEDSGDGRKPTQE